MENNEMINAVENVVEEAASTTETTGNGGMAGFALGAGVVIGGIGLAKLLKWGVNKIKSKIANSKGEDSEKPTGTNGKEGEADDDFDINDPIDK